MVPLTVVVGALAWLSPGGLDAEAWSLHDPFWRRVGLGLTLLWAALVADFAGRPAERWPRRLGLALTLAMPAVVLKPGLTDLRAWPAGLPALVVALPLLLVAVALVAEAATASRRWALLAVWWAALGVGLVGGLRWGELAAQEAVIVSGEAEILARELAGRLGDGWFAGAPYEPDAEALAARLALPEWRGEGDELIWTPAPGVGATVLRLRYDPPPAGALGAVTVLSGETPRLLRPGSRRLQVEIGVDGRVQWIWPDGPPAAVTARRETVAP